MLRRERQPGPRRVAALGSKPCTLPRPRARCEESSIRHSASVATGLLFAGLAPAIVMAALWLKVAPIALVFAFATAFCDGVPTVTSGIIIPAGWISDVRTLAY